MPQGSPTHHTNSFRRDGEPMVGSAGIPSPTTIPISTNYPFLHRTYQRSSERSLEVHKTNSNLTTKTNKHKNYTNNPSLINTTIIKNKPTTNSRQNFPSFNPNEPPAKTKNPQIHHPLTNFYIHKKKANTPTKDPPTPPEYQYVLQQLPNKVSPTTPAKTNLPAKKREITPLERLPHDDPQACSVFTTEPTTNSFGNIYGWIYNIQPLSHDSTSKSDINTLTAAILGEANVDRLVKNQTTPQKYTNILSFTVTPNNVDLVFNSLMEHQQAASVAYSVAYATAKFPTPVTIEFKPKFYEIDLLNNYQNELTHYYRETDQLYNMPLGSDHFFGKWTDRTTKKKRESQSTATLYFATLEDAISFTNDPNIPKIDNYRPSTHIPFFTKNFNKMFNYRNFLISRNHPLQTDISEIKKNILSRINDTIPNPITEMNIIPIGTNISPTGDFLIYLGEELTKIAANHLKNEQFLDLTPTVDCPPETIQLIADNFNYPKGTTLFPPAPPLWKTIHEVHTVIHKTNNTLSNLIHTRTQTWSPPSTPSSKTSSKQLNSWLTSTKQAMKPPDTSTKPSLSSKHLKSSHSNPNHQPTPRKPPIPPTKEPLQKQSKQQEQKEEDSSHSKSTPPLNQPSTTRNKNQKKWTQKTKSPTINKHPTRTKTQKRKKPQEKPNNNNIFPPINKTFQFYTTLLITTPPPQVPPHQQPCDIRLNND